MTSGQLFAERRVVTNLDDCLFYHTMDLPGYGTVPGYWDLRPSLDDYLGHIDVRGKRVLDVGTATGCLAFHLERHGGEVISFDLDEHQAWDVIPYAGLDLAALREEHRQLARRMNNAFWLSHRVLESKVRMVHGSVYAIPPEIGPVDVAVYGAILQHLRDPFFALENALRFTRETVVVTENPLPEYWNGRRLRTLLSRLAVVPPFRGILKRLPQMESIHFTPDYRRSAPPANWWLLSPEIVCEFLGVFGFTDTTVTFHTQLAHGAPVRCFTVVGRRTKPAASL